MSITTTSLKSYVGSIQDKLISQVIFGSYDQIPISDQRVTRIQCVNFWF